MKQSPLLEYIDCLKNGATGAARGLGILFASLYFNSAEDEFPGTITICENNVGILTRAEWLEIRRLTDKFYRQCPDKAIEDHNRQRLEKKISHRVPRKKQSDRGFVYLIEAKEINAYKIGKSRTPNQRVGLFSVALPFPINVLKVIPSEHHTAAELSLHQKYNRWRVNGEWFRLSPQQVEEICSLTSV